MKKSLKNLVLVFLACSFGWLTAPLAQQTQAAVTDTPSGGEAGCVKVGVFNSRSVALAYGRSFMIKAYIGSVQVEMEAAKAEEDEDKIKEIENRMMALQKQLHEQVFSTGNIDNILEKIQDQLPALAKQLGVDLLINKWDTPYLAEGAEVVDITMDMVALFKPDEATTKLAREVMAEEPLPMDEVSHDH